MEMFGFVWLHFFYFLNKIIIEKVLKILVWEEPTTLFMLKKEKEIENKNAPSSGCLLYFNFQAHPLLQNMSRQQTSAHLAQTWGPF